MSNKHKEIEFKYDANKLKLLDFKNEVSKLDPLYLLEISSWDLYYTNDKGENMRHRKSELRPELTIKRKLHDDHNNERIEINIELAPKDQEETVDVFAKLLGYKFDFKIYKTCFIYYFDEVDIVYYIVYDANMTETRRFVEIEYLEAKAHNVSTEHIFNKLKHYEDALKKLGLDVSKRLPNSLYEMYRTK